MNILYEFKSKNGVREKMSGESKYKTDAYLEIQDKHYKKVGKNLSKLQMQLLVGWFVFILVLSLLTDFEPISGGSYGEGATGTMTDAWITYGSIALFIAFYFLIKRQLYIRVHIKIDKEADAALANLDKGNY